MGIAARAATAAGQDHVDRASGWRLRAARFLPAVALVALGHVADRVLFLLPGLQLLDVSCAATFASGLLFGVPGVLGAVVARVLDCLVVSRASCGIASFAAYLILATAGMVAARIPGRFGWRLLSMPSYGVLVLATAISGVLAAPLLAAATGEGLQRGSVASWWGLITSSVIILGPLLLKLTGRPLRRYLPPPWGPSVAVDIPNGNAWRRWGVAVGATVLVTIGVRLTLGGELGAAAWVRLLYVAPLLVLGRRGLHDGILGGCVVGLAALIADPVPLEPQELLSAAAGSRQAGATIYPFIGAFLGGAFDRERRLKERMEQAFASTVMALRAALAERHAGTESHTGRVSRLAVETGRRLGMEGEDMEALQVASILHDIGKIGVPDSILRKPGKLSSREIELMQRHPEIGARILERLPGLELAARIVLHHQERWDGRQTGRFPGYPAGLSGEQIPLGARIIAVADAFDAMTSDREYRRALPVASGIEELYRERGRQFDPRVVDVFLEVLEESQAGPGPGE